MIANLSRDYDGWALSCKTNSLQRLLPLCPPVRVLAWCKPWAAWKKNVSPAYAWEPVLLKPIRKLTDSKGGPTDVDWLRTGNVQQENGFVGAKPWPFCHWLFRCAGLLPTDEFVDLFPGTGMVTEHWQRYRDQLQLPLQETADRIA